MTDPRINKLQTHLGLKFHIYQRTWGKFYYEIFAPVSDSKLVSLLEAGPLRTFDKAFHLALRFITHFWTFKKETSCPLPN